MARCSGFERPSRVRSSLIPSQGSFWRGTDLWSRAARLELDLLGQPKRIVYFDAEIAHGGFDLGMAQ